MRTSGYAVLDAKGSILLRTVSDTARGAKVNWLFVYGHIFVAAAWSEEMIADTFERVRGNAELVEVDIKVRDS